MKKIVIIGANDFQRPLIQKAKEMGYETHVFAWREGATGAQDADYFYEISITEKKQILEVCREIEPDAVTTIGSDLANVTVQYLAEKLGLPGNSRTCIQCSTNKYQMRKAFQRAGIDVPYFQVVKEGETVCPPTYPVIVKPTDRSGSRAITRVEAPEQLKDAIANAVNQSFERRAIVEEFIHGKEYSVETISFGGRHACLAITKKFTTGEPHYIEVGHLQPAPLSVRIQEKVRETVFAALDALQVSFGACHSEVRIDEHGTVRIIEIGSRMGGDCIGSDLVPLSTGQDYVKMVVDTALGRAPEIKENEKRVSAIRFLMNERDLRHMEKLQKTCPQAIKKVVLEGSVKDAHIVDSGSRPGFYIMQTDTIEEMEALLHQGPEANPINIEETPIRKLDLGEGKNTFYIKRDDLQSFAFGGSSVRLAREYVEEMRAGHYDSLVLHTGLHSDLGRIMTTLCRGLELPCYLIYDKEQEKKESFNSRIIRRMKVQEIPCPWQEAADRVKGAMEELEELGYRPFCISGQVRRGNGEPSEMQFPEALYREILGQERKMGETFDYIVLTAIANTISNSYWTVNTVERDGRQILEVLVSEKDGAFGGDKKRGGSVEEDEEKPERCCGKTAELLERLYAADGIWLDASSFVGEGFAGMMEYLEEEGISGKKILFVHMGSNGGAADV